MTKKEIRTYKNTLCNYNCSCGYEGCPGENKMIYITRLKIPTGDDAITVFYLFPEEIKMRQIYLGQRVFEHVIKKLI